jgi:hypothetical protein
MCTLTYLLHDDGYELFFNRDEQRTRVGAIPPSINESLNAIFPVDPQGKGTWIAVNKQGLTLALLNYYQAPVNKTQHFSSRGLLILSLLQKDDDILAQLAIIDLSIYPPFQLCVFPSHLSKKDPQIYSVKWTGSKLLRGDVVLPITSSSIDFDEVSKRRSQRFMCIVDVNEPSKEQLKKFHFSLEKIGKHSVNLSRDDAQTVSISHISVNSAINFNYFDNISKKEYLLTVNRVINKKSSDKR